MKLLNAIGKLRVYKRKGRRAPHKPLLLLYALAEQAKNPQTRVTFKFSEIENSLKNLLDEFWNPPSRRSHGVHYPFWRLREDNGIWEVYPYREIAEKLTGSNDARVEYLRKHNATGSFSEDIVQEIRDNPYVVSQAIQKLLYKYFPSPLHNRILDRIGFDCGMFLLGDYYISKKLKRDRRFRKKVLDAYECSCVVCGFNIHINDKPAGLEAAHIKWHCEEGPDTPDNGLALCATHHELFDLGAFTLSEDYRIILSKWVNSSNGENEFVEKYQKREIRLPEDEDCFPKPEYINWHRKAVFKGPRLGF